MNTPQPGDIILMQLNDGYYCFFAWTQTGAPVPSGRGNFRGELNEAYEIAQSDLSGGQVWVCEEDRSNELAPYRP